MTYGHGQKLSKAEIEALLLPKQQRGKGYSAVLSGRPIRLPGADAAVSRRPIKDFTDLLARGQQTRCDLLAWLGSGALTPAEVRICRRRLGLPV